MASDALFQELVKALGRPSRAYRAAKAGLSIPEEGLKGYEAGSEFADKIQQRKLENQTLSEALGGNVPESVGGYKDLTVRQFKPIAELLGGVAALDKANTGDHWLEKFNRQQDAIMGRQKDRQDFIRDMVGAKGNKEAVNQAKNAVQGLGYVDDLWNEMGKLSKLEQAGASNAITERLFPVINTLKKNVRRTAGFSEGGKNLTANELEIVVQSFEPTTLDILDPRAGQIKRQIAKEYYSGTIDLFEAAKLLGPAGAKLQGIAEAQRKRNAMGESLLHSEAGGDIGGNGIDDVFAQEGIH